VGKLWIGFRFLWDALENVLQSRLRKWLEWESSQQPSDEPADLSQKASEDKRSQRDLLAHGIELINATLDLRDLGFVVHEFGLSSEFLGWA
jgi:hypothetical protein